jgi:hypothetical protein
MTEQKVKEDNTMRQVKWILLILLIPIYASAQIMINNFDGAATDGTINWLQVEADPSYQELENDSADAYEGAAALRELCYFGALNSWGTFSHTGYNSSSPMDWSESETFSVWIKVHAAPSIPDAFVFRMHLLDQPAGGNREEYLYENTTIVDTEAGWVELVIPIIERETDGTTTPNSDGFVLIPTNWGAPIYNNRTLDLDRIVGYSFALVTTSAEEDEIELSFDNFTRSGTPNAVRDEIAVVGEFELSANYPNPFNPTTEISFNIQKSGETHLSVFNLMGQEVATLVNGFIPAGLHHVQFQASNLPAGVFFYRLETADFVSTRKMILLP